MHSYRATNYYLARWLHLSLTGFVWLSGPSFTGRTNSAARAPRWVCDVLLSRRRLTEPQSNSALWKTKPTPTELVDNAHQEFYRNTLYTTTNRSGGLSTECRKAASCATHCYHAIVAKELLQCRKLLPIGRWFCAVITTISEPPEQFELHFSRRRRTCVHRRIGDRCFVEGYVLV